MKYADGRAVRLGDRVRMADDDEGIVVFSIDTDEYSCAYPKEDWSCLGEGVMIDFAKYGLIHFTETTQDDLELIGRASQLNTD
ncbi:hypothetical protein CO608_02155 [Lysobacteraceae bacterium NML08-0793]|nr:hypothetical protein CO608_02155 [Xanthomonadaceae bacterium NML08-0793]